MGTRVESDCQALPAVWLPQVTLPPHLRNGGSGSTALTEQSEETGSQAHGTYSISNVVITTIIILITYSHQQESCEAEQVLSLFCLQTSSGHRAPSIQGPVRSGAHGSAPPAHSLTGGGRSLYTHTQLPAPHLLPLKSQESACSSTASPRSPVLFSMAHASVKSLSSLRTSLIPSILEEHRASLAGLTDSLHQPLHILVFM